MIRFIFDLDGTVTTCETIPVIADHFHMENDMEQLTRDTVAGNVPFIESFIKRVHLMSNLPVDEVNDLVGDIPLYPGIAGFIKDHSDQCTIATGNLDCWVSKMCNKIGCCSYTSRAAVEGNTVKKLETILRKENIVKIALIQILY